MDVHTVQGFYFESDGYSDRRLPLVICLTGVTLARVGFGPPAPGRSRVFTFLRVKALRVAMGSGFLMVS